MPALSALLGWRRRSRPRHASHGGRRTGKATLVPPGLTASELSMLAGSVLFYFGEAEAEGLPGALRPVVATLLWRAARLVVMGERGSGPATQGDLERCGQAIYRHLRMRRPSPDGIAARMGEELDSEIDRHLQLFFSGPHLPFALLVERLVPDLGPGPRARLAGLLEELIRDLGEQFGVVRQVNAVD
jgi:hypothetical protein